jgi:hypothetical protein
MISACPALSNSVVGKTNGRNAAVDDYLVQIASNAGWRRSIALQPSAGQSIHF